MGNIPPAQTAPTQSVVKPVVQKAPTQSVAPIDRRLGTIWLLYNSNDQKGLLKFFKKFFEKFSESSESSQIFDYVFQVDDRDKTHDCNILSAACKLKMYDLISFLVEQNGANPYQSVCGGKTSFEFIQEWRNYVELKLRNMPYAVHLISISDEIEKIDKALEQLHMVSTKMDITITETTKSNTRE
jgi:hypothetical protein